MYLETTLWVQDEIVARYLQTHQLLSHHSSDWCQNETVHNLDIVLQRAVDFAKLNSPKCKVLGILPMRLPEQGLIRPSNGLKINHLNLFPLDSPQPSIHLEEGKMVDIMLQKCSFTNDHIPNFNNPLPNFLNSIIFILVFEYFNYIQWQCHPLVDKPALMLEAEAFRVNDELTLWIDHKQIKEIFIWVDPSILKIMLLHTRVILGQYILGTCDAT